MREFFLQTVDEHSGYILAERPCVVPSLDALRSIINPEPADSDLSGTYRLEREEAEAIMQLCRIRLHPGTYQMQLESWDKCEGLSYRLHAGRELPLMLSRLKPFSYLYGIVPPNERCVEIPEYLFDPYVDAGFFVKREYSLRATDAAPPIKALRYVLYALKHEAWRIDAFILLQNTAEKTGWNEALTRMEGTLLGYEEWQNDAFIEQMNRAVPLGAPI
jgi:hypothetical protein